MNRKRENLLDVADQLFSKQGLKKTTIDEIAREAAIGKGTVYLYFTSKEEIFLETQRRQMRLIFQKLRSAVRQESTAEAQFRKFLHTRFAVFEELLWSHRTNVDIIAEVHLKNEWNIIRDEYHIEECAVIRGILELGIENLEFTIANVDDAVWVLRNMLSGITMALCTNRAGGSKLNLKIDPIANIFLCGIQNHSKNSPYFDSH